MRTGHNNIDQYAQAPAFHFRFRFALTCEVVRILPPGTALRGPFVDLAEGRSRGDYGYSTYILLANPSATAADVTVTFLPEGPGVPIVKTYSLPPTSRFNIDVGNELPELDDRSFGARVHVTSGDGIAVERSLYWSTNGIFWAGGTNALGIPLP